MEYMTPAASLVNIVAEEASCSACADVYAAGQHIRVSWNGGCPTTAIGTLADVN